MHKPLMGWLWISWEKHRRTESLCCELDIPLYVKSTSLPLILRQLYLCCWTILLVARVRPKGIVTQNPSAVLAVLVVLIRPIFRFHIVVDAHNEAVTPFIWTFRWAKTLYRFLHRAADVTIVTNVPLANIVRENGGNPVVLEDKIPLLVSRQPVSLKGHANIACISTFAKDEPIDELLSAVRDLGEGYHFYMTGNLMKWEGRKSDSLPRNLHLTGFLSEEDYEVLLNSVDIIIDLTLMDNCLVCGAYEGVALGKPLVLSESPASLSYFCRGVIHTKNDAIHIKEALLKAVASRFELAREIEKLKVELEFRWQDRKEYLLQIITALG